MNKESKDRGRGVRPHLRLKLKPGWRYDTNRHAFVAADGHEMPVGRELPRGCTLEYTVPELGRADPGKLSEDEKNLARHMMLIFSRGTDPNRYIKTIARWECIEEVAPPPEISPAG